MNTPLNFEFLQSLGLTFLLGTLIGLERERRQSKEDPHVFGIRTMALTALLGFFVQTLFAGEAISALFHGCFMGLVLLSYAITAYKQNRTGTTTEIGALFVYMIGVLMARGETVLATIIGLIVLFLLHYRSTLRLFAAEVEREEVYDTVKFILIAFVILPLLPNESMGPLEVFNPYTIWLMVVLVSSISFVSYVGVRLLGAQKGIGLGGFLGGLMSSTAVSMSFSQMSRKAKGIVNPFVFGILIASTAMFFRVLLEVSIINAALLDQLTVSMGAMGGAGLLVSFWFWWKGKDKKTQEVSESEMPLNSPFQLKPALKFGALFALLLFLSKYASLSLGDAGVYLTALISGTMDVDAITISMASLELSGDLSTEIAVRAITIAAITNTLVKGGIVYFFASPKVGRRTLASVAVILSVGVVSLLV